MKKLEFETGKGRFLLIDSKDAPSSFNRYLRDIEEKLSIQLTTGYKLSEITEEQVSVIVDNPFESVCNKTNLMIYLEDKGIHLFRNPYLDFETLNIDTIEAEENTFKNPYIFKICTKQQS